MTARNSNSFASKLSKQQKAIIMILFEAENYQCSTRNLLDILKSTKQPQNKHSFETTVYVSIKGLRKRGLIEPPTRTYQKTIRLTDQGIATAEKIGEVVSHELKFTCSVEKFNILYKKLYLGEKFLFAYLTVKGHQLSSIQREVYQRAIRYCLFHKEFFDNIQGNKSIYFRLYTKEAWRPKKKLSTQLRPLDKKEIVTVETRGKKVLIRHRDGDIALNYENPEAIKKDTILSDTIFDTLPFNFREDGVPIVGYGTVPLDVHFTISLADLKDIFQRKDAIKALLYRFTIKNGKLSVTVGNFHSFSDLITVYPTIKLLSGQELDVFFKFGFEQIVKAFTENEIHIWTKSNAPALFVEESAEFKLGVLIPPKEPPETC